MCQKNGEGGQRAGNGRCITAVEAELGGLMLFDLFSILKQGHRHSARTKSAIPVEAISRSHGNLLHAGSRGDPCLRVGPEPGCVRNDPVADRGGCLVVESDRLRSRV